MRASLFLATLLAILAIETQVQGQTGGAAPAAARPAATAAAPSGTNVALVDVSFIFRSCPRVKQAFESIQKQAEEYQAHMRQEEANLKKVQEQMQEFKPGTPEFKERDEALAKKVSELQLQGRKKQQELAELEAHLYYDTYKEIETRIAEFSIRRRIGLVMRFSRDKMTPDDGNSIKQGLSKLVVWHGGLDITNFILEGMNAEGAAAPSTGEVPPAGTATKAATAPRTKTR